MRGNRDLVVGERFAAITGMKLLPDPTLIYVQGESVLISHGDIFCTDDTGYQRYRRAVNHPVSQAIYNNCPFWLRNRFVQKIRSTSKNSYTHKAQAIMDVNQGAVNAALRNHDVITLLHGHTHRPAIHRFELGDAMATRIVLGDWYEQGSVLRWNSDGPELCKLDF
jgi:UDP-2,3-diacylglucosamine hydrolase